MSEERPVTMLVTYRPSKGKEKELRALVEKHGRALRGTGLISSDPVRVWRAVDKRGAGEEAAYFVEMFAWRDSGASALAHQTPEVMAVWEPMSELLAEMTLARLELVSQTD